MKREPISKRLRFQVLRRDNYCCVYCGRRAPSVTLEIDHQVPVSAGGGNDLENLVAACLECNRGKGTMDHNSFVMEEENNEPSDSSELLNRPALPWMSQPRLVPIRFKGDIFADAAQECPASYELRITDRALWEKAETFSHV